MMIKFLTSTFGLILCFATYQPSYAANINAPQAEPSKEVGVARGVLRAGQTADITAAMTGQLLEAPYKSGEYFKAGALLVKFDCTLQEAELKALQATHQTRRLQYENAAELYQHDAGGRLDVTIAQSEMQQTLAEIDIIQARLKYCTIYAPFSGHVITRHLSEHETPQQGQTLYSLQRADLSELSVIAPSKWMTWLKTGQRLDFTVDETGEVFEAKIIRIGAAVDPISQTIEIIAKPKRTPKALTGMSGVARFKPAS